MLRFARALLLLACVLPAAGGKVRGDDISTSTSEREWFKAAQHLPELEAFCETWEGLQGLSCFDLFSHSQRVSSRFVKAGLHARSFDIRTSKDEDMLSKSGFLLALGIAMEPPGQEMTRLFCLFMLCLCLFHFVSWLFDTVCWCLLHSSGFCEPVWDICRGHFIGWT